MEETKMEPKQAPIIQRFRLDGRVALVTGSSQGIGYSIARALGEQGAEVILHARPDSQELEQARMRLSVHLQKPVQAITADLGDKTGVDDLKLRLQSILGNSHLDILVINASVQYERNWYELNDEELNNQWQLNLVATLKLIEMFYPSMADRAWGRILTIGSVQQIKPNEKMLTYAATKAGLYNIVQNLSKQLANKGVLINNLAPGVVATERNGFGENPEYEEMQEPSVPLGRVAHPDEMAAAALYFCSEAASYTVGANLFVDGGFTL